MAQEYDWIDKVILIVEDDKYSFYLLQEMLFDTGASFLYADEGIKAIELCKENPKIDLVLMDILLPGCDGLEVTRNIKEIRKDLPVIAQTALVMVEDKEKCLKAGCDDYISKPIERKRLLKIIDKYLYK